MALASNQANQANQATQATETTQRTQPTQATQSFQKTGFALRGRQSSPIAINSFSDIAATLGIDPEDAPPPQRRVNSPSGTDWNPRRLREALSHIPSDNQAEWFKVGAALHHASGGSEEGFELWDEWSRTTKRGNYDPARQRYMWDRYFDGSGRITVRTIYGLRKEFQTRD